MIQSDTLPSSDLLTEVHIDPWRLLRRGGLAEAASAQDESLFALANGSLGVRANLEEMPSASQGSFLAAAWERSAIEYHERFPGFARSTDTRIPVAEGTGIALQLDGQPVRLDEGEWLAFERELDLRHACYRRRLHWRAPTGALMEIRSERLVPLEHPGLLAIRYEVRSTNYRGPIRLISSLEVPRTATGQGADPRIGSRVDGGFQLIDATVGEASGEVLQQTQHSQIRVVSAQQHVLVDATLQFEQADRSDRGVSQIYVGQLSPGQSVILEKYVAYAWSEPGDETPTDALRARAEQTLQTAILDGYSRLQEQQTALLAQFWQAVDLSIPDDPSSEQALRFNLFHIFQSTSRNERASAAAKGLTGEGYEGHYFWDTEAFMLPALIGATPELARKMLMYRYRILDRARLHAREMDHARGALYAWRTISGDECSAYFPSGSAQYHINAAIAWAIRLYVDATDDQAFLRDYGAEMLFETARIWLEAGHFNPRREGAFCIHAVTGPDEYSALVDNNHYTNRMAQRHLHDAAKVAEWLRREHPTDYASLMQRIGLQADEPAQWRRAADNMYLPIDARLGIFPQDDAFLDRPRLPLDNHAKTKQPLLLRMHPLTIYRHQVCKQADTVLALVLAGEHADRAAKRRNLEYYEGVTVHDSTLSASTFSVLAAEVGQLDKAWHYFRDAVRVDLDDSHGNAAHGVHMASMAGSWLALTWGFGGLRVIDGMPTFAPTLPASWSRFQFGLCWRGAQLRIAIARDGVSYTLIDGDALEFKHGGERQRLQKGESRHFPPIDAPSATRIFPRALKGVIFDLDGVIADTAIVHHAAWKQLADELKLPFDERIGERLKGVDRMASLDIVLGNAAPRFSTAEKHALAERKNAYYVQQVQQFGPQHLLPGARDAILSCKAAGLKVALASASKNAPLLLQRLGIADLFDYVVDAGSIRHSKPDPEIFLAAAAGLGLQPTECLGVEDAAAGVTSIHAAGMAALGIGDPQALAAADRVLAQISAFRIKDFYRAAEAVPA